jgi:hypothetical protein
VNECYCGTVAPLTPTLLSDPADNAVLNECHLEPRSSFGCPGDRENQYCGSVEASDVYVDPTFTNVDRLVQVAGYEPLGCFTSQGSQALFFGPFVVSTTQGCIATCAGRGHPYAGMVSATECHCGTAFAVGEEIKAEACDAPCSPGE